MAKNNINKTKYGFSLFEVCVTMGIVAIFIAACTNVFTARHKARIENYNHGRFECYLDKDGRLYEGLFDENNKIYDRDVTEQGYCTFKPPVNLKSIVVNAVAAGGNAGELRGGGAGDFTSFYLSDLTKELYIRPGKAVAPTETIPESTTKDDIMQTKIYDNKNGFSDSNILPLVTLSGGADGKDVIYFSKCTFASKKYTCGIEPTCTINNTLQTLTVNYCAKDYIKNDNDSPAYDPILYRSVTIPYYNTGNNTETVENIAYFGSIDNCSAEHDPNLNEITEICSDNKCDAENLMKQDSKGLITYSYSKVFCGETGDYDYDNSANNPTVEFFSLKLNVSGNTTNYRNTSKMNGIINSLAIPAGEDKNGRPISGYHSIAQRLNYQELNQDSTTGNVTGTDIYYRISTGDGGVVCRDASPDYPKTKDCTNSKANIGGHGSVLIAW